MGMCDAWISFRSPIDVTAVGYSGGLIGGNRSDQKCDLSTAHGVVRR